MIVLASLYVFFNVVELGIGEGGWPQIIGVPLGIAVLAYGVARLLRLGRVTALMPDRPRYMISVAADLVGMHPQTLRMYEAKGLVRPGRTPGGTRLYSDADVERLRLIQRLTTELGLNLAGVEHVLRLQDELNKARARMDRLERELRAEIAEVHRSYKREVVLYRPASIRPRGDDMDFQKLTLKSQEAVAAAQELARRAGNPELTPDHLTIGAPRSGASAHARRPRRLRLRRPARRGGGAPAPASDGDGRRPAASLCPSQPRARRRVRRDARRSETSSSRSSISCSRSTWSRATRSSRRSRACAAGRRSRHRIRRARTRRSRSTGGI